MANLQTIGPYIESQPLNDNFAALNSAKLETSGGTISGSLIVLGELNVGSGTGKLKIGNDAHFEDFDRANSLRLVGESDPTQGDLYFGTSNWKAWHDGNCQFGGQFQRFSSGKIAIFSRVTVASGQNSVIFPMAFPGDVIAVTAVLETNQPATVTVEFPDKFGFIAHVSGLQGDATLHYIAWGA